MGGASKVPAAMKDNDVPMELLNTITELSHEFGTPDYVKGGGGNTSAKSSDTLWVKPSGTTLSGLSPEGFVAMDRAKLSELYSLDVPEDPTAREALVKDAMAAAVRPGQDARPSVEAPLHDTLSSTFVVHTHPALVNGMTCAREGGEACERLFPDALWVPYTDPGFTLCRDVRERVQDYTKRRGREPSLVILANHGIFVSADTAEEIRSLYQGVMRSLQNEYARAGVAAELRVDGAVSEEAIGSTRETLRQILGADATGIACGGRFAVASGPISPDHIVYAKSFPYDAPLARGGVEAFRERHGYTPLVFVTEAGVFAAAQSQKRADLALELATDGALIRQLADAFGGIQYVSDAAREFIENWEVETYRQKQIG